VPLNILRHAPSALLRMRITVIAVISLILSSSKDEKPPTGGRFAAALAQTVDS